MDAAVFATVYAVPVLAVVSVSLTPWNVAVLVNDGSAMGARKLT